jgi:hypothetical protein
VSEAAPKPGAAREATLNATLGGRGAGGAPLSVLRERARVAYDALELPRWRRSGFWQTSFEDLDLDSPASAALACSCSATPRSCTSSSTRSWRRAA